MNKDLPEMFKGSINKDTNNNERVFSTLDGSRTIINNNNSINNNSSINNFSKYEVNKKINDIFNSSDYVYKVDVTIVTEDGEYKKRVVGRVKDSLITMDNEKIPIDSIIDIYK